MFNLMCGKEEPIEFHENLMLLTSFVCSSEATFFTKWVHEQVCGYEFFEVLITQF